MRRRESNKKKLSPLSPPPTPQKGGNCSRSQGTRVHMTGACVTTTPFPPKPDTEVLDKDQPALTTTLLSFLQKIVRMKGMTLLLKGSFYQPVLLQVASNSKWHQDRTSIKGYLL